MPTFDASKAKWLSKKVVYTREKLEVRARNSEKGGWRRALNVRSTQAVSGLPTAIPGQMKWSQDEHRIVFGWKSILPVPSAGIGMHARDDKGVYLICTDKVCRHVGANGAVARRTFNDLVSEVKKDFGLVRYGEDFIYGQFYRNEGGTHTFVRLLPDKVDSFDRNVIELLRARRLLASLPFVFGALEVLALNLQGKIDADRDRARARLVNGWRHCHAISRAVGQALVYDDNLPQWKDIKAQLDKGDKADLENIAGRLTDIATDKGDDWSTEGARKVAALLARTFFTLQGVCLRARGPMYLTGLGIQLLKDGEEEDYRFPILPEARAEFKEYLDRLMAVRQLNDNGKKNGHVMYADALAAQLKKAVTDLEVLELFGMNLAYVAWAPGYKVKLEQEVEKTIWPDLPSLVGEWEMVERVAQPQDDPDYPGFVVCVWKRGSDFIVTPKGTSSEDGADCAMEKRTRDQADKKNRISTGVEADGDPAGIAYHATKKYFKKVLLEKMKAKGLSADSKIIVTGHSLGGALTERLHLKLYEAGFKHVWSMAFSPPALDARTMSKALYNDDAMGPDAFDRLAASGGTWDVVTKGGDTGACIPMRILAIRPWEPGTFTPVPYSVCGDLPPDQYFLQHGTMFQHENKVAGWRLLQKRKTGDVVREDEDDSYNIYSYCRDVTVGLMEYTRTPWSMEKMMTADAEEKKVRQKFGKKVGTDAAREEKGSFAKYVKQVIVVNQAEVPEFKKEENRLALEGHLEEQGKEYDTGVRFFYLKDEDALIKKLKDATWASGCILNPGAHHASEKLRDAIKELKFKVVEVHTAAVDAAADKVKDAAAQRMNKGIFGYGEALEWLKGQMG